MFAGKYNNSLDTKNRIIIPSKFRKELGGKCFLSKGLDGCLDVYTVAEWEHFMNKLLSLKTSSKEGRAAIRFFNSNTLECEVDKQGRMTIPEEFRNYAGISREVITLGVINKLEIWNEEKFSELASEEVAEDIKSIEEVLKLNDI